MQEREAKRAKLKSENASAYIQQDAATGTSGQGKPITAVCRGKLLTSTQFVSVLQLSSQAIACSEVLQRSSCPIPVVEGISAQFCSFRVVI